MGERPVNARDGRAAGLEAATRVAPGLERLGGRHAVGEALRARRRQLVRLYLEEGSLHGEGEPLEALAQSAGVPVDRIASTRFARLAGPEARSQGVLLDAGPLPEVPLDALLAGEPGQRRLVALDGVEDPQNVGAVIRVAEAAGAGGLLMTHRRAPPLSPAVARASAGALEHLPIARVTNLPRALGLLKESGFWSLGAEPDAVLDLYDAPDRLLAGDLIVVLGAEGRGLRRGVRSVLDHEVRIPMLGRVESLNVSSAAAILLFELQRRARIASLG